MERLPVTQLDSRLRGNDELRRGWTPACAPPRTWRCRLR